jgi:hypothetical protein
VSRTSTHYDFKLQSGAPDLYISVIVKLSMIRIRVDIKFSVWAMKFEELAHMENCVAILHRDESKVVTPYKFK